MPDAQSRPGRVERRSAAYLPAILLAFISPIVSFTIDALIAIYFAASKSDVPGLVHRAALKHEN